jgi:hypothetical protein
MRIESLLGIFRRGWENKIRIDLQKIRREGVDRIAQDRDNWRGVRQTCGIHEMQRISLLAEALLFASQQRLVSMALAFCRLSTPAATFTVHINLLKPSGNFTYYQVKH